MNFYNHHFWAEKNPHALFSLGITNNLALKCEEALLVKFW
jgi:hypothetical protein